MVNSNKLVDFAKDGLLPTVSERVGISLWEIKAFSGMKIPVNNSRMQPRRTEFWGKLDPERIP